MKTLQYSKNSIKKMKKVHPLLILLAFNSIKQMNKLKRNKKLYTDISITEGYRNQKRQIHLFNKGYTKTLNSKHTKFLALDIVPYKNKKLFEYNNETKEDWDILLKIINIEAKKINKKYNVKIYNLYLKIGWDLAHWEIKE